LFIEKHDYVNELITNYIYAVVIPRLMAGPQVTGLYIAAFIESAGEVSRVFERKATDMLANHGIEGVDPESWYDLNAFERAVTEIEDQVGSMTTKQAAVKMIQVDEKIPDQDSARDGFEILETQQRNAFKSHSVEECGQYGSNSSVFRSSEWLCTAAGDTPKRSRVG
jgi:hypothetical protein